MAHYDLDQSMNSQLDRDLAQEDGGAVPETLGETLKDVDEECFGNGQFFDNRMMSPTNRLGGSPGVRSILSHSKGGSFISNQLAPQMSIGGGLAGAMSNAGGSIIEQNFNDGLNNSIIEEDNHQQASGDLLHFGAPEVQTVDIDDHEVDVQHQEMAAEPPEQHTSYKYEQTDTKLMDMTSFDDEAALVRPSDARLLPTEDESDEAPAEAKSSVEINIYESDDEEQEISANRLLN